MDIIEIILSLIDSISNLCTSNSVELVIMRNICRYLQTIISCWNCSASLLFASSLQRKPMSNFLANFQTCISVPLKWFMLLSPAKLHSCGFTLGSLKFSCGFSLGLLKNHILIITACWSWRTTRFNIRRSSFK